MNTAKLDQETEELKHDKVSLDVGKLIMKGRQQKGLTQKDLATKICEKPQVVNEYESGKVRFFLNTTVALVFITKIFFFLILRLYQIKRSSESWKELWK